jgi:[methyl-Co(III) methanol-specific corrinoid protein]:coenzyme M methyltransferase
MKPRDIFLRALHRQPTPRPAVGSATSVVTTDLMRQVGVFFPEAHLNAEQMAALAAAGHTVLGLDNVAPLFSVWHESAAMGCQVDWGTRGRMPDCRYPLYDSITDDITIPDDVLDHPACQVPLQGIRLLRQRLGGEVAIVGKVFGPWTLGYHMFGVEEFLISTILNRDALRKAIASLRELIVRFGVAQIEAGADALCLADHATRDLCSPLNYRDFLMEVHRELNQRLACPLILHICGDTSDRIPYIKQTGIACFHFDSKVPAREARRLAGKQLALMGGTSNLEVIRRGTPERIRADAAEKIASGIDIIGPECAVPLDAPYRNIRLLSEDVKAAYTRL